MTAADGAAPVLREVALAVVAGAEHDADGAALVFDLQMRYVGAGGPALRRRGFDASAMVGRSMPEVLPAEAAARVRPGYAAALAGKTTNLDIPSSDGRVSYACEFRPVRDERGEVAGGYVLVREHPFDPARRRLSKREREVLARAALGLTSVEIAAELFLSPTTVESHARSAGERLGARNRAHAIALALAAGEIDVVGTPARAAVGLFEHSPIPMARLSLRGRIEAVNRAYSTVLGWPPSEIVGRPAAEIVHPDDVGVMREAIGSLAGGRADGVVDLALRTKRRDGRWRWMSWSGAPSADGTFLYAIGRSIEPLSPVDARVSRPGDAMLRRIAYDAPFLLWVKDADGRYLYANRRAEEAHGVEPGELVGRTEDEVVSPDLAALGLVTRQFPIRDETAGTYATVVVAADVPQP